MTKGIFITATDTGVGKTIVAAMIARSLILNGLRAGVMKPFETGCLMQNNELIPLDGMFLKEMSEVDDPIDLITPVRFQLPLSPLAASRLEKKTVDIDKIFKSYEYLSKKYDFLVVEGAGGILVPVGIKEDGEAKHEHGAIYISDIIKEFGLPTIVVSRPTLGTINHTLLTVNHAINEGIRVIGIIINYNNPAGIDISEKTNPDIIKELSPVPVLGILPHSSERTKEHFDRVLSSSLKEMFDEIVSKITGRN